MKHSAEYQRAAAVRECERRGIPMGVHPGDTTETAWPKLDRVPYGWEVCIVNPLPDELIGAAAIIPFVTRREYVLVTMERTS